MITYIKHREKDPWPIAGNLSPHNWKSSTVTLSDIYLGDSRNKIADAVHNTADADLVAAFAATNRLLQTYRMASDRSTFTIYNQKELKPCQHFYVPQNIWPMSPH